MSSRFSRHAGVAAFVAGCVSASCGPDSHDAGADAGLGKSTQAIAAATKTFAPDRFRDGARCSDCEVLHSARLTLPETKVVASSAKLRSPDGRFLTVTIDETGAVLDEAKLIAAERSAVAAKYGKLRPELYEWLAKASPDDLVWVWVRTNAQGDFGRREDHASAKGVAARDKAKKAVDGARGVLRGWLAKNAPEATPGDDSGPIVRVRLTAKQVRELALVGGVELLGTDQYPGERAGSPWSSYSQWGATLRLPEAHALGTGSAATVCVKENARPDLTSQLTIEQIANPAGATSEHARASVGLVRNTGSSPYTSVAPLARLFMANWSTNTEVSVDAFCQGNYANTLSYSHFVLGATAGPLGGTDMQHDWLAKASPFILVVAAAGDVVGWPGDAYVRNRGFNGLVVGGVHDLNTADRTDDVYDDSSAWQNPTTTHGDYELPNVAAPTNGADSVGTSLSGTSAATAMVSGIAALVDARGPDLTTWPEGKRAVILATATGRADQGILTSLPAGDQKIGAGVVDAFQASDLAASSNAVSPIGNVAAAKGRMATTLDLSSSFGADNYATAKWRVPIAQNGRLRVAMAWDASASCSWPGGTCTSDVPDADLDLHVFRMANDGSYSPYDGSYVCASSTYDSTWELCDLPVVAGENYLIAIKKYGTNASYTYLGLAWYQYQSPSGAACNSGTECASGACSGGRCTCTSDAQCPDRFCNASGQCTTRQSFGAACTRAAECNTGSCADGVCCSEPCTGVCRACSAAKKGTGIDGVCEPIVDGANPEHECTVQSCASGTVSYEWVCNGAGACRSNGSSSCGAFACSTTAPSSCATTCSSDSGCAASYWCSGTTCVAKLPNGTACSAAVGGRDCLSGFCVDGVCCNSGCGQQCQACDVAGSAGTCTAVVGAPHGGRTACAGSGACGSTCNGVAVSSCTYPALATSCSDGNACNGVETCDGVGACTAGTPIAIDDGDACTTDACAPATGAVSHTPITTGSCGEKLVPTWPVGATLTVTQLSPTSARLSWTAASHPVGVAGYRILIDGIVQASTTATTWDTTALATPLTTGAAYAFRIETYAAQSVDTTTGPSRTFVPAPELSAPTTAAATTTVATSVYDATSFIYGPSGTQKDVTETIDPNRAAALRGFVRDASGSPIAGARITILNHGGFGYTFSRVDGAYDMVVNGGGRLTVQIAYVDHVMVQRTVDVDPRQYVRVPDVTLTRKDVASPVTLGTTSWAVAESSTVKESTEPDSAKRHGVMLFQKNTLARKVAANGTTTDLPALLNVRATEVTTTGLSGMPGELPPTTAYTYAVAFEVEGAADAARVEFVDTGTAHAPKPVVFYVKAVAEFPKGSKAPLGYYDTQKATWVAYDSGLVVRVAGANVGGKAALDVTGDTGAESESDLNSSYGISVDELAALAGKFADGDVLWRVSVPHFSTWDINWATMPPLMASFPTPKPRPRTEPDPCPKCGSIVLAENQVLGERIPIAGTPLTLEYWSDRVPGYKRAYSATIEVSGAAEPATPPRRIVVEWQVAGRVSHEILAWGLNKSASFAWDGRDLFGRLVQGRQPLTVRVGYVYGAEYGTTSRFGYNGGGSITGVRSGGKSGATVAASAITESPVTEYTDELTLWSTVKMGIGELPLKGFGLGGWDFGQHHAYDTTSRTLLTGSGERRQLDGVNDLTLQPVVYVKPGTWCFDGHCRLSGVLASEFQGGNFLALGSTSDGTVYFVEDFGGSNIWKVTGSPAKVYPVVSAYPVPLNSMAIDGQDRIYVGGGNRIFRLDGTVLMRVAGSATGSAGKSAEDQPAVDSLLNVPSALAFAPDGTLFFSDAGNSRIGRITADGLMSTFVGGGTGWPNWNRNGLDGQLATTFAVPATSLAVDRDGTVVFGVSGTGGGSGIWRVDRRQRTYRVAGTMAAAETGDGGPALDAATNPVQLEYGADGALIVREYSGRLRAIGKDGVVRPIALNGGRSMDTAGAAWDGVVGDGMPMVRSDSTLALDPQGRILLARSGLIWRIASPVADTSATEIAVPSSDGRELFVFDVTGRHLKTTDALTGKAIWTFGYDGANQLTSVTDLDGNVISIVRTSSGVDLVDVARGRTTKLTFDGSSRLQTVADPEDYAHSRLTRSFTYEAGDLLRTLVEANGTHTFTWDLSQGLLLKDENAAGGSLTLTPSSIPDGWRISIADGLSLSTQYDVWDPFTGADAGKHMRKTLLPDGTWRLRAVGPTGGVTETTGGGSTTLATKTTSLGSEPLFGLQAPLRTTSYETGGLKLTPSVTRTYLPSGCTQSTWTEQRDTTTLAGSGAGSETTTDSTITRTTTRTLASGSVTGASVVTSTGLARQTTIELDGNGRITKLKIPGVGDTTYFWTSGRLTSMVRSAISSAAPARTTQWTYNVPGDGTLASIVPAEGSAHTFDDYDLVGRVKQQTLPGGDVVSMTYDPSGNLATLNPPGRPAHQFTHTKANLLETYTAPLPETGSSEARMTTYEPDLTGFNKKTTLPGGATLDFTRDLEGTSALKGRLYEIVDSQGDTARYAYAMSGLLTDLSLGTKTTTTVDGGTTTTFSPNVSLSFGYAGQLPTSTTWAWPSSMALASSMFERTFDNHFRVRTQKVFGGTPVTLGYDADGLLQTASVGGTSIMTLTRNTGGSANNGLLTGSDVGLVSDSRTYNDFGEVSTYSSKYSTTTNLLTVDYEPTVSTRKFRDRLGRIVMKTETVLSGSPTTVGYQYDTAGRLWKVTDATGATKVEYHYGTNGTRDWKKTYGTPGVESTATTVSATYDDQDRLKTYDGTSYTFRASGELLSKGSTTFGYDGRGNLRTVAMPAGKSITYLIDGQNRRVGKTVSGVLQRRWLYDGQLRIVGEIDEAGTTTQYVYATRPNVPEVMIRDGLVYRLVTDHLGSLRLVVNASDGTVKQRMDYDEFGNVEASEFIASGWKVVPFGFAGGLYDRDTELVRFGARDYDAETGRWTAKDPIGFRGGDPDLFGYALRDPVNLADANGKAVDSICAFIVGMGAGSWCLACGLLSAADDPFIGPVAGCGVLCAGATGVIIKDFCDERPYSAPAPSSRWPWPLPPGDTCEEPYVIPRFSEPFTPAPPPSAPPYFTPASGS